jgi:hypothetical protein
MKPSNSVTDAAPTARISITPAGEFLSLSPVTNFRPIQL